MTVVISDDAEKRGALVGALVLAGYPAAGIAPGGSVKAALCAVVFAGETEARTCAGRIVSRDRVVTADGGGIGSASETARVLGRIDEVLEATAGLRYESFSARLYAERCGRSVFLGREIPLTEKERLIVRCLEPFPGEFFTAFEIASFCRIPSDGAVRTHVSKINGKAVALTDFRLIVCAPGKGYAFAE